jgi:DNA-binding CsgD family transcriptional regulator
MTAPKQGYPRQMKSAIHDVARFATLLTRNPTTEDLLNSVMRDFLSALSVTAIEIQLLTNDGSLVLHTLVGLGIDGDGAKSMDSFSQIVDHPNVISTLEESGSLFDPAKNLTITLVTVNSSVKGFYLFQHASGFAPDERSSDQVQLFSNLLTIYLSGKLMLIPLTKTQTSPATAEHVSKLTARQLLILTGMVEGKTNHELSIDLGFSVSTIRHETMVIYKELGVSDRKEAARVGQAEHLI